MTNTVYVFLKADAYSVQLVERVLTMVVGGYSLNCSSIQFVVVDLVAEGKSANQPFIAKISELIRQYNKLRTILKDFTTILCNTDVAPIMHLAYSPNSVGQCSLLQASVDIKKSIGLLIAITDKFKFNLDCKDKIIITSSINEDFNFERSILSNFYNLGALKSITLICDLTNLLHTNKHIPTNVERAICELKVTMFADEKLPLSAESPPEKVTLC